MLLTIEVFCGAKAIADEYRELTGVDGKTVRAKVLSYSQSDDKVQLERDNRKRFSVPVSVFCKADQSIIRNWDVASRFLSEDILSISVERVTKKTDQELRPGEMACWSGYDIKLENRRGTAFKHIRVETSMCQILKFVRKEPPHQVDSYFAGGSTVEIFQLPELEGRGTKVYSTERLEENRVSLRARDKETNESWERWQEVSMTGIWIRLYMKLPDGSELMREFKEPEIEWDGFIWSDDGVYHPEHSKKKDAGK
ncbi:hypothetical protein P4C99_05890 [Pontiellaceae bacterium B1224]|nr:hypothetical protein [Pontiellaceae bacterium B1224]